MLNFFDIIIVIFVAISVLTSFLSGFISSFLGLVRLIASISGAFYLRNLLMPFFYSFISDESIRNYLAYIASFLLLMIGLSVVRRIIITQMESFAKGAVDRSMGATLGLLRSTIIICVIFLLWMGGNGSIAIYHNPETGVNAIHTYSERMPEIVYEAASLDLIVASTETIINLLPVNAWEKIRKEIGLGNKEGGIARFKTEITKHKPHLSEEQEVKNSEEIIPSISAQDQEALHNLLKKLNN